MSAKEVKTKDWELTIEEFRELLKTRFEEAESDFKLSKRSPEEYIKKAEQQLDKATEVGDENEAERLRWIIGYGSEDEEIEVATVQHLIDCEWLLFSNVCERTGNKLDETKPVKERDDEDLKQIQQVLRRHEDHRRLSNRQSDFSEIRLVPESILGTFSRFFCFTFDPVSLGIRDSNLADRILELLTKPLADFNRWINTCPTKSWDDIWVIEGSRLYELEIFRRYVGVAECVSDFCFEKGIDPAPLWRVGIALDAIVHRYHYSQQEFDQFQANREFERAIAEATLTLRHIQIKTGQKPAISFESFDVKRAKRDNEKGADEKYSLIKKWLEIDPKLSNPELADKLRAEGYPVATARNVATLISRKQLRKKIRSERVSDDR